MKYRVGKISYHNEKGFCIEYNETDLDDDEYWYELEDFTEEMCKDIAELLNTKYSKEPYYKYKKPNKAYVYVEGVFEGINERIAALGPIDIDPKDL